MVKKITLILAVSIACLFPPPSNAQADWINVKDHGAAGNGSTNDTSAILNAISILPARGGVIYFPAGRYRISQRIDLPDKRVVIRGDGVAVSALEWTSSTGGLRYSASIAGSTNGSDDGRELGIFSITLRTTQQGGGVAINASWPETPGQLARTLRMRDVEIRGSDFAKHWTEGVVLSGGRNSLMDSVNIYGASQNITGMSHGIKIVSNGSSTEYKVDNAEIYFAGTGIRVTGGAPGAGTGPEGIYINQPTIVGVNNGIVVATTVSEPLVSVRGGHINANVFGIRSNALQAFYHDNLIYHMSSGGVGISITGSTIDVSIRNNNFYGHLTNSNGVVVDSGPRMVSILGNHFHNATTAVWLQSGSMNNYVSRNVFTNTTNNVLNHGTGNFISGW